MAKVYHRYVKRGEKTPEPSQEQRERDESATRLLDARTRKESALADLREAESKKRKGELIEKATAVQQASFLFVACRQRFLALATSLPRKLEGKTQHEMKMIIDGQIREALTELSELPDRVTRAQLDFFNEAKNGEKRKAPRQRASVSPVVTSE